MVRFGAIFHMEAEPSTSRAGLVSSSEVGRLIMWRLFFF